MGKYNYTVDMDSNDSHARLIRLVGQKKKVLEIGCASGYVSRVLTERYDCDVTGIELNPDDAEMAREACSHVITGDIEKLDLGEKLGEERFDVVAFGDVLEHLVDPWTTLKTIKAYLKSGGYVVATIPNVSHIAVILGLLDGQFNYGPLGLLDDTHLRFFTKNSLEEMFCNAGYEITHMERLKANPEDTEFRDIASKFPSSLLKFLEPREDLFTYQFLVKAVPSADVAASLKTDTSARTALDDIREMADKCMEAPARKRWSFLRKRSPKVVLEETATGIIKRIGITSGWQTIIKAAALKVRRIPGTCPVCGRFILFKTGSDNLRETMICPECGSSERQRQISIVLLSCLAGERGRRFRSVREIPPETSLWNTHSDGALHKALSKRLKGNYFSGEYESQSSDSGETRGGHLHVGMQEKHLGDGTFNVIISNDLLANIPKPLDVINETYLLLRPGGIHLSTVPFRPDRCLNEKRAHLDGPVRPAEGMSASNIFSFELLCDLERAGFIPTLFCVYSPLHGILGKNSYVIAARKSSR